MLADVAQWWQRYFPQQKLATVHAADEQRLNKVALFRQGMIDTLMIKPGKCYFYVRLILVM